MRYLVKSEALYMQQRTDIFEILYNENVEVHHGFGVVRDEVSYKAIAPRGFRLIAEIADDDTRTLDELIEAYPQEPVVV